MESSLNTRKGPPGGQFFKVLLLSGLTPTVLHLGHAPLTRRTSHYLAWCHSSTNRRGGVPNQMCMNYARVSGLFCQIGSIAFPAELRCGAQPVFWQVGSYQTRPEVPPCANGERVRDRASGPGSAACRRINVQSASTLARAKTKTRCRQSLCLGFRIDPPLPTEFLAGSGPQYHMLHEEHLTAIQHTLFRF